MDFSYWERNTWFSHIDFTVVGSGIVGLNCALQLRRRFPKAKIVVLEKGLLPQGASTKNAGFACFGSISEIRSDLQSHSEEEVVDLVRQRYEGIQLLRKTVGDVALGYQELGGGHEVFQVHQQELLEHCLEALPRINSLLKPVFGQDPFVLGANSFGFHHVLPQLISNPLEGQLDTGSMMESLLHMAASQHITVLNNCAVNRMEETSKEVTLFLEQMELHTDRVLVATNGFAQQLVSEDVRPARAQVLITKPIANLHVQGTFHLDEGYYYFRNVGNRLLLGGGRNLDKKGEETTEMGQTPLIQNALERLLEHNILPNIPFEIDHRWSGIMGVGPQKRPVVKQLSERVFCGIRLGGMGVALGSHVGRQLANLVP